MSKSRTSGLTMVLIISPRMVKSFDPFPQGDGSKEWTHQIDPWLGASNFDPWNPLLAFYNPSIFFISLFSIICWDILLFGMQFIHICARFKTCYMLSGHPSHNGNWNPCFMGISMLFADSSPSPSMGVQSNSWLNSRMNRSTQWHSPGLLLTMAH